MNLFQAANGAATFLILSAIVAGLAKHLDGVAGSPLDYLVGHTEIIFLGLFIVIFRIKTLLDDHRHFAESFQDRSVFRYVGFVLAVISWVFWGLAAYLLASTIRASELMAVSVFCLTLWIGVHILEISVDKERRKTELLTSVIREKWVLVNVGFMLLLVSHVGWFRPIIPAGAKTPLILLLVLLFLDVVTSRSFTGIIKPSQMP